jgi:predicted secreted Zn-dependent protease
MLRARLCAALLLSFLKASPLKAQECPVATTYSFYSVSGVSADEIKASMLKRGPRDDFGSVRFAYTDWSVKWKWKRLEDGSVNPDSVKLSCTANILLPELDPNTVLSPELRDGWNGFVERTRQHELNHVAHVEQMAPEIYKRLRADLQQSGRLSGKRASAIVSEVIAEIKALDRRYDAETDHGCTEGAWRIQPTM